VKESDDIYRVFDSYLKDRYVLNRLDCREVLPEDFYATFSEEKSMLSLDVQKADVIVRQVSHLVHSNWIARYFATERIGVFPNKFTFVSFKGKSHDKDVKIDEKKKLAKLTKIKKEEDEIEEKS